MAEEGVQPRAGDSDALPAALDFLAPSIAPDLIRLGNWTDGGYVVPYSAIASADALISCGINRDWSFEKAFHEVNPSAVIHAYDHTISLEMFRRAFFRGLRKWLIGKGSQAAVARQLWLWRDFRAFFGGPARHFEEKIVAGRQSEGEATIERTFSRVSGCSRIFLKVDIEGDEYSIIEAIMRHASRTVALAIEFHNTAAVRNGFCDAVQELQREFEIVHLHGNNCGAAAADGLPRFLEMSFIRRSGARLPKRTELPIPIDRPNSPNRPDFSLRFGL
jgi:hypothetical protein